MLDVTHKNIRQVACFWATSKNIEILLNKVWNEQAFVILLFVVFEIVFVLEFELEMVINILQCLLKGIFKGTFKSPRKWSVAIGNLDYLKYILLSSEIISVKLNWK